MKKVVYEVIMSMLALTAVIFAITDIMWVYMLITEQLHKTNILIEEWKR